jgi:broad specificity polyphosphatase/5'/3'-nucleotidase SurE
MPKKKKVKNVMVKPITNHDMIQINIPKSLDDEKKIKPEKVFEGYKQSNISKATKKKKK